MTQEPAVEKIYWSRLRNTWLGGLVILLKILRNGGIFIAFIGLLYVYGEGLKKLLSILPSGLWSACFLGAIVALYLTRARIRTLLQRPDLVFLLPAERAMAKFFRVSFWYSAAIQVVHLFLLLAILVPLFYFKIGSLGFCFLCFLLLSVVKVWNVHHYQIEQQKGRKRWLSVLLRLAINLLIAVALFDRAWLYVGVGAVLALLWSLVIRGSRVKSSSWPALIEQERKTLSAYLSIANFFVDIPTVKNRVIPRKWLTYWLHKLPLDSRDPFFFLFARTFIRQSEYFGIFVRLTLLLVVILVFVHAYLAVLATLLIGLYITGLQLPNIGENRRYPVLMQIYPQSDERRTGGFTRLATVLLFTQCIVLCLPLLFNPLPWLTKLILAVISFWVTYLICRRSLPKRFAKLQFATTDAEADATD